MRQYYHNTTPDNPDNVTLCYLSHEGDCFETIEEWERCNDTYRTEPTVEIIIEGGLVAAEPFDQYMVRTARRIAKELGLLPKEVY
jgi:hypothetical protein